METIKVKLLNERAVMPTKAHASDAGYDLTATSKDYDDYGNVVYGTGVAVEIPEGYVGLVFPRSSSANTCLILSNCVGVIDAGYRGEITCKFTSKLKMVSYEKLWHRIKYFCNCTSLDTNTITTGCFDGTAYKVGDRIAQLVIVKLPDVAMVQSPYLSDSERGKGGYGSTGK